MRWPGRCSPHFYSRPCGRGDGAISARLPSALRFLLTPLREGRPVKQDGAFAGYAISTHAPAGGATHRTKTFPSSGEFLLTPLREGRPPRRSGPARRSRFLLTPLREGRPRRRLPSGVHRLISTHAPAGGATCFCDSYYTSPVSFLLTPLREGRPGQRRRNWPYH